MAVELILRDIRIADCQAISDSFLEQGWVKSMSQYLLYFDLQDRGKRDVIIAESKGDIAGYLTIKWESDYLPFKKMAIPEIVDFNVLFKHQRQGIGTALMIEAEIRIAAVSRYAGIGFGVTQDYGAAQILYIKRNYVPDGKGLVRKSASVKNGEVVTIGDDVAFYLIKEL